MVHCCPETFEKLLRKNPLGRSLFIKVEAVILQDSVRCFVENFPISLWDNCFSNQLQKFFASMFFIYFFVKERFS